MADFVTSHYPKARVAHRRVECRHDIAPGERYVRVSGATDGRMWAYEFCRRCDTLNKMAWDEVRRSGMHEEDGPRPGDAVSWLLDALDLPDILARLGAEAQGHFLGLRFAMLENASEAKRRGYPA